MKYLLISMIVCFCSNGFASRLIEVEDYYSQKASDYIKTRYPRKAFSIYVKVDAEDKPQVRQPNSSDQQALNLPYLDQVDPKALSFWDRKDVSLGTLISYLRGVFVKVDIDGDFSDQELDQFKSELFQHLKLSELYDRVDINRRQWQGDSFINKSRPFLIVGALGILGLAALLFLILQLGVSRLVKGLAQPLSEIGRSTENLSNSSSMMADLGGGFQLANQRWDEGVLPTDHEEKIKNDIQRLSHFMSHPDAELIQTIEQLGAKDPLAMGSIFAQMPTEDLQGLITWARGDWWRVAITQMTPLTAHSADCIGEISRLNIRKQLLGEVHSDDLQDLKRVLARLDVKHFGELFKGYKFEEAQSFLRMLPQTTMINVAKYLYPGQWAELLEAAESAKPISSAQAKKVHDKALEICPLKSETEIAGYFRDADLLNLLDRSTTKDEREIYKVLDDSSWIKRERVPFYSLFQESKDVLERLGSDLPLELWALAITACDRQECETLFEHFTAKQRFMMRNFKTKFTEQRPHEIAVVAAKKRILNSLVQIKSRLEVTEGEGELNEAAA